MSDSKGFQHRQTRIREFLENLNEINPDPNYADKVAVTVDLAACFGLSPILIERNDLQALEENHDSFRFSMTYLLKALGVKSEDYNQALEFYVKDLGYKVINAGVWRKRT